MERLSQQEVLFRLDPRARAERDWLEIFIPQRSELVSEFTSKAQSALYETSAASALLWIRKTRDIPNLSAHYRSGYDDILYTLGIKSDYKESDGKGMLSIDD